MVITCDLHEDETEGVETVKFGFDGYDYEMDVCAEHGEQVQDQLQDLNSHTRRAGGGRGGGDRRLPDQGPSAAPSPGRHQGRPSASG